MASRQRRPHRLGRRRVRRGPAGRRTASSVPRRSSTRSNMAAARCRGDRHRDTPSGGDTPANSEGLDFFNTGVKLVTDSPDGRRREHRHQGRGRRPLLGLNPKHPAQVAQTYGAGPIQYGRPPVLTHPQVGSRDAHSTPPRPRSLRFLTTTARRPPQRTSFDGQGSYVPSSEDPATSCTAISALEPADRRSRWLSVVFASLRAHRFLPSAGLDLARCCSRPRSSSARSRSGRRSSCSPPASTCPWVHGDGAGRCMVIGHARTPSSGLNGTTWPSCCGIVMPARRAALLNGLLVTRLKLPPFIVTLGTLNIGRSPRSRCSTRRRAEHHRPADMRRPHAVDRQHVISVRGLCHDHLRHGVHRSPCSTSPSMWSRLTRDAVGHATCTPSVTIRRRPASPASATDRVLLERVRRSPALVFGLTACADDRTRAAPPATRTPFPGREPGRRSPPSCIGGTSLFGGPRHHPGRHRWWAP